MKPPDLIWSIPKPVQVPEEFAQHVGGHPIVAETLFRRGVCSIKNADAFLNPEKYAPASPYDLPDLQIAVNRIKTALQNGEKLGVWGDFDVDGQTSTTLLVDALRQLGGEVIFHIPVRAKESHGINIPGLQTFLDQGVQLLITCDTGITAHEAVDYANNRDVPVIITDHHQLAAQLPAALAAVNPQRLPPEHPLHPLCGVGCAYQVIRALYAEMVTDPEEQTDQFLDLVALGTVADIAELKGDNRWLVQRGLARMCANPRKSILAILNAAEVSLPLLSEEHISFQLAPRLNALGRLGDANPIVDFFLSEDEQLTRVMAARLEGLNSERRFQTRQIFKAAQGLIEQDAHLLDYPVLVLGHPEWTGGVIGIVASHLVEIYQRPVILLTTPENQPARGSARSVEGIDITKAISACQELLHSFGGHPMAAGLSLPGENIPGFRRMLGNAVREQAAERPTVKEIPIDGVLGLEDLTLKLAKDIDRLSPFGPGNPSLNFLTRNLTLKSHSKIGKNKEHRQMIVENKDGLTLKFLWWQSADYLLPENPFDLAYTLRSSNFRGNDDIQLTWIAHHNQPKPVEIAQPQTTISEIIDHRHHPQTLQILAEIQNRETSMVIWGEDILEEGVPAMNRQGLAPADALVIWTAPPSRAHLQQACKIVSPQRVYLFDHRPSGNFLPAIQDTIQTALTTTDGWISIADLASRTAQTEIALNTLLELFVANGQLTVLARTEDQIQLARGGNPASQETIEKVKSRLQYLLAEVQAYRRYYASAQTNTLNIGI